jgi:uncharacterized protein involved in exopolysaccharide biosynthesis
MGARDPNVQQERDPATHEDGDEEGFDFELLKEKAGFVLHAVRRRPKLAAITFIVVAALGLTVSITMPRLYNAQVKLLAQVNLVVPALSNPNRAVPREAENPTKNVADQILRRDNVIALAKAANLVDRYYASRSLPLRLKDRVLGGAMTPDDKLRILVGTLEKRLAITVQENNVIIEVDWSDPQMAYDLVTLVQKNFLEARYDDEVAMITDAIGFLQEHAKTRAQELDRALEEYQKRRDEYQKQLAESRAIPVAGPRAGSAPTSHHVHGLGPVAPSATPTVDPDLATALDDSRQQIRALEAERQREIDTLRGQLAQAQLTLTPQHPTVIALQEKIDALSGPDAQLTQLKAQERSLMAQIAPVPTAQPAPSAAPHFVAAQDPSPSGVASTPPPAPPPIAPTLWDEDARTQILRSTLEGAIRGYQDAVGRIDVANTELEILRTAFKYRYTVVTPAEVPRGPKKPTATLVGIGSVIGALLLAFTFAGGADWWSGRILEEWQVRRQLKLDILGEFYPPTGSPPVSASSSVPPPASTSLAVVAPATPNVWEDARLQKLWLATQRREWRSLAVIGAGEGVETLKIGEMLAQIAWAYRGQPSAVFDLRDLGLRLADYQMREVQTQVDAGVRAILALRSTSENPTATPLARLADAVVLCIDLARTRFDAAERTIAEIGRDRVIGSIIVCGYPRGKSKA